VINAVSGPVLGLAGWPAYLIVAALVFAEAALFVGFVLPGETAVVLGGVLASFGRVPLPLMVIVVIAAAIGGDSVSYEVGRRFGPRVLVWRSCVGGPVHSSAPSNICGSEGAGRCSSGGSPRSCGR